MFNTFTFNSLGFNYFGIFRFSFHDRPNIKSVFKEVSGIKQVASNKPMMVDGVML